MVIAILLMEKLRLRFSHLAKDLGGTGIRTRACYLRVCAAKHYDSLKCHSTFLTETKPASVAQPGAARGPMEGL